jgi:hypothetical protein
MQSAEYFGQFHFAFWAPEFSAHDCAQEMLIAQLDFQRPIDKPRSGRSRTFKPCHADSDCLRD